jgi:hypothetical protein
VLICCAHFWEGQKCIPDYVRTVVLHNAVINENEASNLAKRCVLEHESCDQIGTSSEPVEKIVYKHLQFKNVYAMTVPKQLNVAQNKCWKVTCKAHFQCCQKREMALLKGQ